MSQDCNGLISQQGLNGRLAFVVNSQYFSFLLFLSTEKFNNIDKN